MPKPDIKTVSSEAALRKKVRKWRRKGKTIGFVPTMGALHDGHLSLIDLALKHSDRVIASIFVNPTQFAEGEDLDAYPRQEKQDLEMLAGRGCHLAYLPVREDIYFEDHSTTLSVGGVAEGLETDHRPHFFDGVVLVVSKLFNLVQPDVAVFGQKDFQQLQTIKRMVRDLNFPIKIIGAPIARDNAGLALSSRNQYFDAEGLAVARELNQAMFACRDALHDGTDLKSAIETCKARILSAGFSSIDYVTLADSETLTPLKNFDAKMPSRLLVAAHCKGVRLIDNCAV